MSLSPRPARLYLPRNGMDDAFSFVKEWMNFSIAASQNVAGMVLPTAAASAAQSVSAPSRPPRSAPLPEPMLVGGQMYALRRIPQCKAAEFFPPAAE